MSLKHYHLLESRIKTQRKKKFNLIFWPRVVGYVISGIHDERHHCVEVIITNTGYQRFYLMPPLIIINYHKINAIISFSYIYHII